MRKQSLLILSQHKDTIIATLITVFILLFSINFFSKYFEESIENLYYLHYTYQVPLLIAFILGLIHGLIPHEHTWPITIPYAISQGEVVRGILAAIIFTGALTLIWSIVSELVSISGFILLNVGYNPIVNIVTGLVMIIVGLFVIMPRVNRITSKNSIVTSSVDIKQLPYRYIWIHGLSAAFSTGCLLIITYTLALTVNPLLGWCVGLLFGLGTMITQVIIAYISVKLSFKISSRILGKAEKAIKVLALSGTLTLVILGMYLTMMGVMLLHL